MIAALFGSPTARMQYGWGHRRAWVKSLAHWMPGQALTLYGSSVPDAGCDLCPASRSDAGREDGR